MAKECHKKVRNFLSQPVYYCSSETVDGSGIKTPDSGQQRVNKQVETLHTVFDNNQQQHGCETVRLTFSTITQVRVCRRIPVEIVKNGGQWLGLDKSSAS